MELDTTTKEEVAIVTISGSIDSNTWLQLDTELNRIIVEKSTKKVLLNFKDVTYLSSAGIRALLIAARKLKARKGWFGLSNLSQNVFNVLDMSGFTSIFNIFPNEDAALAEIEIP
jgi:anti-sigma B factor antagonist